MSNSSERTMDYFRVRTGIFTDPKFTGLLEYLQRKGEKCTERDIFGSLGMLWGKAALHFNDGEIRDEYDLNEHLAKICGWTGDAILWSEALLRYHWIDKNEGGYYIHNWMEKHAREWWLKNEDAEHKRQLQRNRAAKHRERRRNAEHILREKGIMEYDASPPPPEESNAPVTQANAFASVRNGDESFATEGDFTPPPGSVVKLPVEPFYGKSLPQLDAEKSLKINEVYDNSVTNAFGDVRERDERTKRREEKRERVKDKDGADSKIESDAAEIPSSTNEGEGKRTNQQILADHFKTRLEVCLGEPTNKRSFKYGYVVSSLIDLLYDPKTKQSKFKPDEVKRRMDNWFDSTWKFVSEVHWSFSKFLENFNRLKDGPMNTFDQGGTNDGGMDRPKNIETKDDF